MVWYRYHEIAKKMKRSETEYKGICNVFLYAVCEYESRHLSLNPVSSSDVVEFKIRNNYIEQCEFLSALGIGAVPRMIDDVRSETVVQFPFSLFSVDTEDDVMEKLNSLSSPKKKSRIKQ